LHLVGSLYNILITDIITDSMLKGALESNQQFGVRLFFCESQQSGPS